MMTKGRSFGSVGGQSAGTVDAHQGVVAGPRQGAAIDHHVVVEEQHRRAAGLLMLGEGVAGLAHGVPEQDGALRGIDGVFRGILRQGGRVGRRRQLGRREARAQQPRPAGG